MIGDEQLFPGVALDSSAAFPEAPMDSVSATSCRESDLVRAVAKDRRARVSVSELTVVPVPMQRSRPRRRMTPEPPALLT